MCSLQKAGTISSVIASSKGEKLRIWCTTDQKLFGYSPKHPAKTPPAHTANKPVLLNATFPPPGCDLPRRIGLCFYQLSQVILAFRQRLCASLLDLCTKAHYGHNRWIYDNLQVQRRMETAARELGFMSARVSTPQFPSNSR